MRRSRQRRDPPARLARPSGCHAVVARVRPLRARLEVLRGQVTLAQFARGARSAATGWPRAAADGGRIRWANGAALRPRRVAIGELVHALQREVRAALERIARKLVYQLRKGPKAVDHDTIFGVGTAAIFENEFSGMITDERRSKLMYDYSMEAVKDYL